MKITLKKSFAVILALVMCVSVLFGMNLSVFAASNTIDYVYDSTGTYIYNWGIREQEATFLSQNAEAFYNQNPIATLLAFDGSSDINAVTSSELYEELHSLMKNKLTKPTSYNGTRDKFQYTDCENSAKTSNKISSFYSGNPIGPDWDGGNTWNREHTWPNSKGEGQGENDIMMLRPTAKSENGGRSNTAYGESGSYYNPNEESNGNHDLRGDVARIALYQYVCWGGDGNATIQSNLWGYSGVIESKKVLLKWMQEDPVDTWELGRNDSVQSITGTRNVFVDYPELAFDLFNVEIPKHQTPSGYANGNGTDDDVVIEDDETNDDTTTDNGAISGNYYEKVTTSLSDWSGDYLIVYEAGNKALNGGLSTLDAVNNTIDIAISDGIIEVNNQTTAAQFEIIKSGNKYTVKSASGLCIGQTSGKNALGASSTYVNSLSISNGGAVITAESGYILAFNTANNQLRFRYYNSTSSYPKAVLYKLVEGGSSGGDEGDNTPDLPTNVFSAIANDDTFGTVTTNGNVVTVTPADGYKLSETEPYLVEGGEATVTDNGNGTYTISNVVGDATISFNFEATTTGDEGTTGGTPVYQKITSTSELTSGDYLIVYETGNLAFNGALASLDAVGNTVSVEISNNQIASTDATNAAKFTIDVTSGTIKSASGLYIGRTADKNELDESTTTQYANTISIDASGNANIVGSGGAYLRYNKASDQTRFRYFKSSSYTSQQAIQLYKLVTTAGGDTPDVPSYTITAESNSTSYGTVTLTGNTITAKAEAGYTLADGDAAYTVTSGTATVVRDGDTFTVTATSDATITINFVALPEHTVQFMEGLDGDVLATTKEQYIGGQIVLPAHSDNVPEGYEFRAWAEQKNETDNSKWVFAGNKYPVNGDTTLYAQYSAISNIPTTSATITFDDRVKRTEFDATSHQTWTENGIIVTNNKGASTSAIADYAAPVRFYKNSELIVSLAATTSKITKIVVNANNSTYANNLKNAISDSNAVVSVNSKAVTIEFKEAVYMFEVALSVDAIWLDSMDVSIIESSSGDLPKHTVTFIETGNTISKISAEHGSQITLPRTSGIPGETLVGWVKSGTTDILELGSAYIIYGDATFTAKYEVAQSGGSETTNYYKKVTSSDELTDGKYLIVYESGNLALNGSLSKLDAANNGVAVEITNNKINANDTTTAAQFTINFTNNTITSSLGYYIGSNSTSNVLSASTTTKYTNTISIDANGNAVITGQKGTTLQFNSDTSQKRFRYFGSGQQAVQLYKLVEVGGSASEPSAEIKGAQVSVGSDLSLSYYVNLKNIETTDEVVMKVTLDGKTTEIDWKPKDNVDGKYIFTLNNIPPQAMTATITAEIWLNGEALEGSSLEYTIKQNAKNLLAAYGDDQKLARFISDMLYYGAAAQKYTGYNTENLATDDVTGLDAQSTTAPTTLRGKVTATSGQASFKSATVWFDVVNKLIVKFNNPEGSDIKVCIRDEEGNETELEARGTDGFITDGILASEFDKEFTFVLYEDGVEVQTLIYSVNAYASSKHDSNNSSEEMKQLALALYNYGVSAKAYAESIA